ncbi:MAG TPA: signal peptidase II [Thermomicrobiales bacterium]|nr:signal peptidase II [Thermomicrobiales bacterium]
MPFLPASRVATTRPASIVATMNDPRARHRFPAVAIVAGLAVLVVDFVTKTVMTRWLEWGEQRWLIDGWIGLELTRNRGLAFGLGNGSRITTLLVIAGFVALVWFILRSGLVEHPVGAAAFGLAVGGAMGNLIDRIRDGAVTDFFVIGPWPRFNIADSALTLGLIALALIEFRTQGGYQGV